MFPAQDYGCTFCGAYGAGLQPYTLATAGALLSFAVVHSHPKHPVPFVLGDVALDGGPIVRAEIGGEPLPEIGARLGAVVSGEPGEEHLEFRRSGTEYTKC